MSRRAVLAGVLFLALAVAGVFCAGVRAGLLWWGMDDFTAYVVLGRNLADGLPYDRLDTVHDPGLPPSHLHDSFPPFLPLLIATLERFGAPRGATSLVEEFRADGVRVRVEQPPAPPGDAEHPFGFDTKTIKRVLVVFFALSLVGFALAFRRQLPGPALLAFVALLGFHPYLFAFKELVRAELPFLAFLAFWFASVEALDRRRAEQRPAGALLPVACGALLYLAYATRSAAVVLVPALLVWDVWRWRRLRVTSLVALAVAALGYVVQKHALGSVEGGYVAQAQDMFSPAILIENASQLVWKFQKLCDPMVFDHALELPAALFVLALAVVGAGARLRRLGVWDVFAAGYLAMIVLLPTHSAWLRYLIPLLPVLLLDVVAGACRLAGWRPDDDPRAADAPAPPRARLLLGMAPLALLFVAYGGAYASFDRGPLRTGLTDPDTVAAYAYVAANTAPDEIVVSSKNRTLTLVTGRPALPYPQLHAYGALSDAEMTAHFERIGARLFLLKHSPAAEVGPYGMLEHSDRQFLEGWEDEDGFHPGYLARHPDEFEERYRNDDFVVYAWRGR